MSFDQPTRTDDQERWLDALCEIARLIAAQTGERIMLQRVATVLERNLGGAVVLLSHDEGEFIVEAAPKDPSFLADATVNCVRSGQCRAVSRQLTVVQEACNGGYCERAGVRRSNGSFMCVPVTVGDEVVGSLSVDLPQRDPGFLQGSQQLLSIVACMIGNDVKARRRALAQKQAFERENLRLREALGERFRPENIIGNSNAMRQVYARIAQVAPSDTTVLIRGESGTGKELAASAIHYSSPRADQPFVKVNCAALGEHLLESEMFGHEKGAFTSALRSRVGRIEEAQSGTLFLDEIGDFPPSAQVKLLRVIQEKEFQRVGSNKTLTADVRIIAATNRNLEQGVRRETFREDLFYRINVFPIRLPPLRERRDDILLLADYFTERYAHKMGKEIERISTPAINMMFAYHWPGNVRELENCIEHAVLLSNDGVLHGHCLPPTLQIPAPDAPVGSLKARVQALERDMLVDALKRCSGNLTAVARDVGITPRMVRYKLRALGIEPQAFVRPDGER